MTASAVHTAIATAASVGSRFRDCETAFVDAVVGIEYSGVLVVGLVVVATITVLVLLADEEAEDVGIEDKAEEVAETWLVVLVGSVVVSEVEVADRFITGPSVGSLAALNIG